MLGSITGDLLGKSACWFGFFKQKIVPVAIKALYRRFGHEVCCMLTRHNTRCCFNEIIIDCLRIIDC